MCNLRVARRTAGGQAQPRACLVAVEPEREEHVGRLERAARARGARGGLEPGEVEPRQQCAAVRAPQEDVQGVREPCGVAERRPEEPRARGNLLHRRPQVLHMAPRACGERALLRDGELDRDRERVRAGDVLGARA